jgi:hypothetical protein
MFMDQRDLDVLRDVISAQRLAPYEQAAGGDMSVGWRLYAWNIEVSAAFHGLLGCLEIALRNAMHVRLVAHFGRDDWWHAPTATLHWLTRQKITNAETQIARRRQTPDADRVVTELSLGFWVSLLGPGDQYELRLWRPALHLAFPGYHGPRRPLRLRLRLRSDFPEPDRTS